MEQKEAGVQPLDESGELYARFVLFIWSGKTRIFVSVCPLIWGTINHKEPLIKS